MTGASGFVGRHLMAHLAAQQCQVTGWGAETDIRDASAVAVALQLARPDAVIHLAAIAAPGAARADPAAAQEVNVQGTLNVAQALLKHAPQAVFVFVGSSESYGTSFNASELALTEEAALAPVGAYGKSKAEADETIGKMARNGLRAVRLRPFNHTGPGQAPIYVVSDFARQIATIEANDNAGEMRVGNLDARRDFLDVRDVVRAYAACCTAQIEPGTAINIATGQPLAIRDILDRLIALSTADIRIAIDPSRLRPSDIAVASGDPSRAATLLDWRPTIALNQTLTDVLNYWRGALAASQGR